jgi:4-amino-4-deoxy-L-arabinose transferase-like glycosyltransferase
MRADPYSDRPSSTHDGATVAVARPARATWRRDAAFLAGMISLALALRLYYSGLRTVLADWDSVAYLLLARSLEAGDGFREYPSAPPHTWFQPLYPYLIGLASRVTPDFEAAGQLVSAVFGSLLAIPMFFLASRIYSRRVGYLVVILLTFNYRLTEASSEIITEMAYTFFWLSALVFTVRAIEAPFARFADHLGVGLCLGLAALTRTEGTLYLLPIALFLTARALTSARGGRGGRALACWALAILSFAVTVAPYLVFLHDSLGHFTITGRSIRTVFAVIDAPTETYEFHEEGTFEYAFKYPLRCMHRILHNVEYIMRRHAIWAFPPITIALIAAGFFGRSWGPRRLARERFLLAMFLFPWVTFYGLTGLLNRYYLASLALGLVWVAHGVDHVARWLARTRVCTSGRAGSRGYGPAAALLAGVVLLSNAQQLLQPVRLGHFPLHADERKDRSVGQWIKEHSPQANPRVMCASPRIAYYAEGIYFGENSERLDRTNLAEYLAANRIDYLAADAFFTKQWFPNLGFLADGAQCPDYLRLATQVHYAYDDGSDGYVNVYQALLPRTGRGGAFPRRGADDHHGQHPGNQAAARSDVQRPLGP